jgi:hypothetical protein
MEMRMEEPYIEGVASHGGPEPCKCGNAGRCFVEQTLNTKSSLAAGGAAGPAPMSPDDHRTQSQASCPADHCPRRCGGVVGGSPAGRDGFAALGDP